MRLCLAHIPGNWRGWAQGGDKVCTGGMMTGEKCGWKVTDTQVNFTYSGGTKVKNMVVAKKTSASCTINGDSGGPVYTVDSSGRAFAKGIAVAVAATAAGCSTRAGCTSPTLGWPTAPSPEP
jgi:hypothetical protein